MGLNMILNRHNWNHTLYGSNNNESDEEIKISVNC